MSLTTRFGLVAGTTALAIAGSAFGGAESDNDALAQIAELKRELAELKQAESQDWLTEQRASEIRGIVQDVLADADTRTSFQNSGAMAGWNKGFFLASPDGNFKLNVQGFVQVRYVLNSANGQNAIGSSDRLWGFENRRTWLDFSGNVFDPSWSYKVRGEFADGAAGAMSLSFAYVQKDLGDGLSVRVGQFRAPWLREELVDDQYQLGVERSLVNAYFTQGFNQGIQLGYESDQFRGAVFAGDSVVGMNQIGVPGLNVGNGANTTWDNTPTRYAFAGRGEYKISGTWDQFDDFTSFRGEEGGMLVGVAGVWQSTNDNAAVGNVTAYGFTGDFTWDFGGANLFASFVWMGGTGENIDTSHPWGVNIQGGYFVTDDVEVYARYEYIKYDIQGLTDGTDTYNGFTIGANYFFAEGVRFSVDWGLNLEGFGAANGPALTGAGFRQDASGEGDQWALRAQLQLLF